MDGKRLEQQYIAFLSDYFEWNQKEHAADWLLFPENIGPYLSIDETSLSQGELYTIITNKQAKGRKGALVAILKGIDADQIIDRLKTIKESKRFIVREITLDMSPTMVKIAKKSFPKATIVTDRFHVQQLAYDAVQEMRIAYRWEAIELENKEIELAKRTKQKYIPDMLENGDTLKQLLARSRYILFKRENKWTPSQHTRAELLFRYYPDLELAYNLAMKLGEIYHTVKDKGVGFARLAKWYDEVERSGFKSFGTVSRSIQNNYQYILNFFENRNTNASAESFNAKIKAFRSQFRGVRDIPFFLFRLSKIYA